MLVKSNAARHAFLAAVMTCGMYVLLQYYAIYSALRSDVSDDRLGEKGDHPHKQDDHILSSSSFDWSHIIPTKDLQWKDCFEGKECARLSVPMNHHNPNGQQGALALIRKASPLGPDHPDYRGPILFNPGGPGGSGITLLAGRGDLLATIVGPQFDLVSFDPRGVGASIPRASFYKSHFERIISDPGLYFIDDHGVSRHWAKTKVINEMARESDDGSLRYINTDQTARDMLSIVHAHGREKLQYWGFSYGTILGSTFAAMFPDKVERLVIDGVADTDDYYANVGARDLVDTDKGVDAFIASCHDAGPVGCHFWAPTTTAIQQNMTRLFDNVRRNPVSVTSSMGPHGVVDVDLVKAVTFSALYKPYATFPLLAEAYAALAQGDGSIILNMAGVVDANTCPVESPTAVINDAQTAILCNDGDDIPLDLESAQKYFQSMKQSSPNWGPLWAGIRLGCIGWPKFPKTNFRGPFNATTSYPLLVVGNTADPVTPLWSAKKTSEGFAGSVLLTQDSPGHASISAPSVCTQSYIRKYFTDGTLPEPGTVCSPDSPIFADQHIVAGGDTQGLLQSFSAEEQEIFSAVQTLSRMDDPIPRHPLWFRKRF